MPPMLHLVRHAEGYHNACWHGEGIHDPFLTEKGQQQCEELCSKFPFHDQVEVLMASPMKRCIQTCQVSFKPAVERLGKIIAMPLAQEASDEPMDTGSNVQDIQNAFGDLVDGQYLVPWRNIFVRF